MANGILAKAQARLPASMGGTSGAIRNVPASFKGGQGQSLGVYKPKGGGGFGGGGIGLGGAKKEPPAGLVEDWKKTLAQLKENVDKGYITEEQAKAIAGKLKPLYEELGDKYGQPHQYSQELKDAISQYGDLRDGVDYESTKAIYANQQTNVKTGEKLVSASEGETPQQALARAKEQALLTGDWGKAEEYGATDSEIIARGGILKAIDNTIEGPVNIWEGAPTVQSQQQQGSPFDFDTSDSSAIRDAFSIGDDFDTGGFSDFQSTQSTSFSDPVFGDYTGGVGTTSAGVYGTGENNSFGVGSFNPSTGFGGFNRGGMIDYKGAGGMPAQYNNPSFPGEPRGTDTVPLYAEEGEYVVTREGADRFKPLLDQINAYRPPSGTIDGAMSQMDDLINNYAQRRQR